MGQGFSDAWYDIGDHTCTINADFVVLTSLWKSKLDLVVLCTRLKDITLNFSLPKPKFAKLLQLSTVDAVISDAWFHAFANTRVSKVVDGLEFLAASIMINREIEVFDKIELLFHLFDLDDTSVMRRDEFTIFLKAITSGLHRVIDGFPPPPPIHALEQVADDYFASLESVPGKKIMQLQLSGFTTYLTETPAPLHLFSMLSNLSSVVLAWGDNSRQQLGLASSLAHQPVPCPLLKLEGRNVARVATSCYHTLFLTSDGCVFAVGADVCGILGVDAIVGEDCRSSPVFTWGSAQFGQLGHGKADDRRNAVHKSAWDARTGEKYFYVPRPITVQALFGQKIFASRVACGAFSTLCLAVDDAAHMKSAGSLVYSWGNDSESQCAASASFPTLVLADPLLPHKALKCFFEPQESAVPHMSKLAAGGSLVLAVDSEDRVWTWGGHQKPHVVETLQSFVCQEVDVGDASQCVAMCSLYLLELSCDEGSSFNLLGLPADDLRGDAKVSELPILQVGLPFHETDSNAPILNPTEYPPELVLESVLLADRALAPGQWLKLATTDFDFALTMAPTSWAGTFGDVILLPPMYDTEDLSSKVCVFEAFGLEITPKQLASQVWDIAKVVSKNGGAACLVILPADVEPFELTAPPPGVTVPTGVMTSNIGTALCTHLEGLAQLRMEENPRELEGWVQRTEANATTYLHEPTGKRRNAPPLIETTVKSTLVRVKEDLSLSRLKSLVALNPKGIIYCQPSWHPDCELIPPAGKVPIAIVPYEAGEELKCMIGNKGSNSKVTVSFKAQTGGVFSWNEQLGESPKYEKNLHDYQVRFIACGKHHTAAVTERGDVFSWNQADETPVLVEQVEGLANASKVFAGANQTFVLAELPFQSILR
eukprot:GEMP01011200.1.p1 GENE.GEMP01011200.1~~GEMP01011200.1.p1  ORF type:complete len:882 (+),score=193.95 GEMP01011200.1:89-2734(+)